MLYYQVLANLLNNTPFKILWKKEAYIWRNKTMQWCTWKIGKSIRVRYKICRRPTVLDICYLFKCNLIEVVMVDDVWHTTWLYYLLWSSKETLNFITAKNWKLSKNCGYILISFCWNLSCNQRQEIEILYLKTSLLYWKWM